MPFTYSEQAKAARARVGSDSRSLRGSFRRRKRHENAVWWVYWNSVDAKPPGEPERVLQQLKREDPVTFVRQVLMAVLPAPPKEQPVPPAAVVKDGEEEEGSYGEMLEQMLRECGLDVADGHDTASFEAV